MKTELPRGIRNHNPGNIRWSNTQWQGLAEPPYDKNGKGQPAFCCFQSPAYGIRALARLLITYQDKRLAADGSAIDTVKEILERYAPSNENDTAAYIRSVRQQCGFAPGQHLNLHDFDTLSALVKAIIKHENGSQPYSKAQITKGLVMAGVEPAKAKRSRTHQGATVAGGATALAMVQDHAMTIMPFLSDFVDKAPYIFGVIALAGLGYVIYARWDDSRRGLR